FHILALCSQITTIFNDDHPSSGISLLLVLLELFVCVLLRYYQNITGDLQLDAIFQIKLDVQTSSNNENFNILIVFNVKLLSELITLCTTKKS
ncbi:unnamed protein product, partial [Rotaria sordida]